MPRYVFVIEDTDDGGVAVQLDGDGLPKDSDVTPAGLMAMAVDNTIQQLLGPVFEIEDVDENSPQSQHKT